MKYNKEVSDLIVKLKERESKDILSIEDLAQKQKNCQLCNCNIEEHENYIYCDIIDDYICDTCCRYEVCNDYHLVNTALGKDIFKTNNELIMLCEYCN